MARLSGQFENAQKKSVSKEGVATRSELNNLLEYLYNDAGMLSKFQRKISPFFPRFRAKEVYVHSTTLSEPVTQRCDDCDPNVYTLQE